MARAAAPLAGALRGLSPLLVLLLPPLLLLALVLLLLLQANNVRVRGYVSCVVGCPYSGVVAPEAVAFVAQTLLEMG